MMKRSVIAQNYNRKRVKSNKEETRTCVGIFSSLKFYFVPNNFGLGRLNLFKKQIIKNGGDLVALDSSLLDYCIVEEEILPAQLQKIIANVNNKVKIAKCSWISSCLKHKTVTESKNYEISYRKSNSTVTAESVFNVGEHHRSSHNVNQSLDDDLTCKSENNAGEHSLYSASTETSLTSGRGNLQSKFACAHSSTAVKTELSVNKRITDELKKLLEVYQSKNDTWRVAGYQKAIAAINSYPTEITSYEEARLIRGIGDKLASKIVEIINTGHTRKAEQLCGSEETATITRFLGVWGAGPATAQGWYAQGFRTLQDLEEKATLTRHQKIGLKYYKDLNVRIPRAEVAEIHQYVRTNSLGIQAGLVTEVCGSYRRGRATCGDVDILISHPNGFSHRGVFFRLLHVMRDSNFLTDDLVIQEDSNTQKYLGVCKLPGENRLHRRIDIIVVPYEEFAPALLYFTGSAHFNRSMRSLATKLGMSLSEHGLRCNVLRKGMEKLSDGRLLPTPTEESIFKHLDLPYRPPHERDH